MNKKHRQKGKEIRVVLSHDEHKALHYFADNSLEYDNIPHFVREAIVQHLERQGVIVMERGKPRVSHMTFDKRKKILLRYMSTTNKRWVSTMKISKDIRYDYRHTSTILHALEEDKKLEHKIISTTQKSGRFKKEKQWRWKKTYITKPLTESQMGIVRQLETVMWAFTDKFDKRTLKTLIDREIVEMDDDGIFVRLNFTFSYGK